MKYKKSVAVWKNCKRSFKCDVAGGFSFIHLEMAQEWMKTLPCSILQFNWIQKVLKRSSSLWRALTFKRFELQIWDWSWMKENSKIFENTLKKKFTKFFFTVFLWTNRKEQLFHRGFFESWPSTLYPSVISKRIKLQHPAWSHFEDLLKSFKTVMDFAMIFSLDECETLKKNLSFFFFAIVIWKCLFFFKLMLWSKHLTQINEILTQKTSNIVL